MRRARKGWQGGSVHDGSCVYLNYGGDCMTVHTCQTWGIEECKLEKPVWQFFKILKVELPSNPTIQILGKYLEKMRTLVQKDTCTPMCMAALYTVAKTRKQSICPSTNENTQEMEYYSAIKNDEIIPLAATWMGLKMNILSGVRQRQISYDIGYMWNLKIVHLTVI